MGLRIRKHIKLGLWIIGHIKPGLRDYGVGDYKYQ
jgi:hypothetical protein